ncbi:MAG: hypothetical protein D6719_08855 [Candidatus Dadabacteria bacterium]|nr:MAG: hypothetical protein D6719_08855 [Candidatus Dadabacteria bacterium]
MQNHEIFLMFCSNREGGSEKHLQDIRGILANTSDLNLEYLKKEAKDQGLSDYLSDLLKL